MGFIETFPVNDLQAADSNGQAATARVITADPGTPYCEDGVVGEPGEWALARQNASVPFFPLSREAGTADGIVVPE